MTRKSVKVSARKTNCDCLLPVFANTLLATATDIISFVNVATAVAQCDQIGRFLKVFGNKFSLISSTNVWRLFGLFEHRRFLSKNCCGYFLEYFWKNLGEFSFQHLVTLPPSSLSLLRHKTGHLYSICHGQQSRLDKSTVVAL